MNETVDDVTKDGVSVDGAAGARWSWRVLRAGRLLLDGGGMFGVIPRAVWSRAVPTDEQNRVEIAHNCVLLTREGDAGDSPRHVLIETGTGDKLGEKMSAIFGLDGVTSESAVRDAGVEPGEIGSVIVSHLHFDHAGGLTRRVRAGEEPDWIATRPGSASGDSPGVKLTYPNAELIVQKREWVDARNNDSVMTKTYYRDHLLPFEAAGLSERPAAAGGGPRLRLVESQRPFPLNRKPRRDELPGSPVDARMTEVLPGVRVFLVPGHTWGQQAVLWTDADGREVCFVPDVIPTAWHAGAAYSLAYDVEPFTSMVSKRWLLTEAAERGWLLVLNHQPGATAEALVRAEPDNQGWFRLVPAG